MYLEFLLFMNRWGLFGMNERVFKGLKLNVFLIRYF